VIKIHEKGDILGIAENCPQNSRNPKALVDFSFARAELIPATKTVESNARASVLLNSLF
jgi:hypothetical protein